MMLRTEQKYGLSVSNEDLDAYFPYFHVCLYNACCMANLLLTILMIFDPGLIRYISITSTDLLFINQPMLCEPLLWHKK